VACGSDVRILSSGHLPPDAARAARSKETLRHATTLLAVSNELAQEISRFGRRASVVRFTAGPERFPLQPPPAGPPVILFVGTVTRSMGIDLLLEAFALLGRTDARLHIVGPLFPELDAEAEARRLGIGDRVTVAGELTERALVEAYGRASCLVLPSRSEGFPAVIVEAMLTGRPVIATDVGGVREIVTPDVGRLIPSEDPESLTAAIESVLEGCEQGAFDPQALRTRALPESWAGNLPKLEAATWSLLRAGGNSTTVAAQ
jgi:glycosyltransferase involved in cell wall biosynthesis